MKKHIWNYAVNKKVLINPEYVLYFMFKVATFCFDDSVADFSHPLSLSITLPQRLLS